MSFLAQFFSNLVVEPWIYGPWIYCISQIYGEGSFWYYALILHVYSIKRPSCMSKNIISFKRDTLYQRFPNCGPLTLGGAWGSGRGLSVPRWPVKWHGIWQRELHVIVEGRHSWRRDTFQVRSTWYQQIPLSSSLYGILVLKANL